VVEPTPVVAEIPSLNNTTIVEVTMPDDSNIDAEHLAMMKTRITTLSSYLVLQSLHLVNY